MADANDHLVFHVQVDGKIVLKDSDDGRDQEDYWDNKKRIDQKLLANMNKDVIAEFKKDPLGDNLKAQQKSLRNQFNFQERANQTFNLPIREKGIKTDPPVQSNFAHETTQW